MQNNEEPELICFKCGQLLDQDDCSIEDGKPCPLTHEQWEAQYGDWDK